MSVRSSIPSSSGSRIAFGPAGLVNTPAFQHRRRRLSEPLANTSRQPTRNARRLRTGLLERVDATWWSFSVELRRRMTIGLSAGTRLVLETRRILGVGKSSKSACVRGSVRQATEGLESRTPGGGTWSRPRVSRDYSVSTLRQYESSKFSPCGTRRCAGRSRDIPTTKVIGRLSSGPARLLGRKLPLPADIVAGALSNLSPRMTKAGT